MILLPSAAGTRERAAVDQCPGGAVRDRRRVAARRSRSALNRRSPASTSEVIGPRGGALVERMKSANARHRRRRPPDRAVETASYRADVAAVRGVLLGEQRRGDAHLVEVRVGGERLQAGVLALPAEAADARRGHRLRAPDHDSRAAQIGRLRIANGQQRVVGDASTKPLPSVLVEMRNVRTSSL